MESRTVQFWLGRLLAGACLPADVLPLAREAGFPSFAELCSAHLPERLPRLRIESDAIIAHIERALAGDLPLVALRAWADELHAIAFRHVIGKSRAERRRAVEALALVATAADDGLFKTREPCAEVLADVAATLRAGGPLPSAELYGRLFEGQDELHLASRRPLVVLRRAQDERGDAADDRGDAGDDRSDDGERDPDIDGSWADVVVRSKAGRAAPADTSAVVAFAVVTERAASTDDPGHGAPVPGMLTEVRRLAPNFALARYRPRLRRDVDGVLEFVLRTDAVDDEALAYAAKLFALIHSVGSATLDGQRVAVLRF